MSVDPIMLALMKKQLPCYDTRKTTPLTLEWDGEIGERETMDFVGTTFVKMMNEPPSYEELSTATFHVVCTEGFEEEFSNLAVMDGREQGYPFIGVSVNSTGAALCLCFPEDCTVEGVSYKKGLYLAKQEFTESGYIFAFIDKVYLPSVTTGELKTIDPKFLPDSVAPKKINLEAYADDNGVDILLAIMMCPLNGDVVRSGGNIKSFWEDVTTTKKREYVVKNAVEADIHEICAVYADAEHTTPIQVCFSVFAIMGNNLSDLRAVVARDADMNSVHIFVSGSTRAIT